MAIDPRKLEKVKQLLNDISVTYSKLGKTDPFEGTDPKKIAESAKETQKLEDALEGVNQRLSIQNNSLNDAMSSFKSIVQEIKKSDNGVKSTVSSLNSFSDVARKIRNHQEGISTLSVKQIQKEKEKLKNSTANLQSNISLLEQQKNQIKGVKTMGQLSEKEKSQIQSIEEALQANTKLLDGQNESYNVLNSTIGRVEKQEKKIQKDLGITGGILKGISKIPIIGDLFDANEAVEEMEEHLRSGGKAVGALKVGFKNMGAQIKGGVLNPANMLLGTITGLIDGFFQSQKGIGELAKGLGMSAARAGEMRMEFEDIANNSLNSNISVKDLQESQMAIGQSLGTNVKLNKEDLKTMTDIVKKTGLQHDELIGIEKLSLATGKSLDDNVEAALGGATAYASQNKLVVDNNKVLREVNKASGALKLSLGGSVEALGEAVVKAQQFGINLEQAENIASSMLDFESSIEAELEAELLTGKNLNMERARQLALEGDIAGAAEEVLKQLEGSEEFSKMNVIQQEAMAKAVGLTRDQLADSLIEREALAAMSEAEGDTALERYNYLKAQGKTEAEIVEMLGEKAAGQLEQQSAQDKFNASVEKLKEVFTQVMDALSPIFDILAGIATTIMPAINYALQPIVTLFRGVGKILSGSFDTLTGWEGVLGSIGVIALGIYSTMKAISLVNTLITFAKQAQEKSQRMQALGEKKSLIPLASRLGLMVAQAAAWVIMNPFTALLGLGLAAGAGALIYSQMKDGEIDPKKGPTISGEFGTVQMDPRDKAIYGADGKIKVGTDLMGDNKSQSQQTQPSGGGGAAPKVDMTQTNALLNQLISVIQSGGTVTLDGQKVGEALKLGTYSTQ